MVLHILNYIFLCSIASLLPHFEIIRSDLSDVRSSWRLERLRRFIFLNKIRCGVGMYIGINQGLRKFRIQYKNKIWLHSISCIWVYVHPSAYTLRNWKKMAVQVVPGKIRTYNSKSNRKQTYGKFQFKKINLNSNVNIYVSKC